MKRILSLFVLASMLVLVTGFVSATEKCGGADLCTWSTPLPLGSEDTGCGLTYATEWPVNTNAVATCVFDGADLASALLYVSIDNDVVSCTLNGNEVMGYTAHENCAPADPMSGLSADLFAYVVEGENTLVCEVHDYGVMTHFDACVVGTPNVPVVPEFGLIAGLTTVLGALGAFLVMRRK
jgi:hypothetical protein